jgi:hypothetical protein
MWNHGLINEAKLPNPTLFLKFSICTKPEQNLYNACTTYIKNVVFIIFTADWIFWTNK